MKELIETLKSAVNSDENLLTARQILIKVRSNA